MGGLVGGHREWLRGGFAGGGGRSQVRGHVRQCAPWVWEKLRMWCSLSDGKVLISPLSVRYLTRMSGANKF